MNLILTTILMNIDDSFCLFGLYGLQEDDYSRDEIADNDGCFIKGLCIYIYTYIYENTFVLHIQ
jgi:hypothetical protein